MRGHDSYDIENPYTPQMGPELHVRPPPKSSCCIFRVPERLRCVGENVYTPKFVSIGPLHHGNGGLITMEEHKHRYLKNFVLRTGVILEEYKQKIKDEEERLRNYYAETIKFSSEEFVNIILVERLSTYSFKVEHFVDLLRISNQPVPDVEQNVPPAIASGKLRLSLQIPSMTELYWTGVKFKVRSGEDLFDIRFSNGTLEIPKFALDKEIYLTLRNLLAFEQCHCMKNYTNDHVALLDRLVRSPKDVALLVQYGIVEDRLGDSNAVSTLINNLVGGVIVDPNNFYFAGLCEDLNNYCTRNKWKATLRRYLYNKRWEAVSVSAVFGLLLTIVQTVCSVASLKHQKPS